MRLGLMTTGILAGLSSSGWAVNTEIAAAPALFDSSGLPSASVNQTDEAAYFKPILFDDFQSKKTLDAYQFEELKNISTILVNKQTEIVEKHKIHAANITQIVNNIEKFNGIVKGLKGTHLNKSNFALKKFNQKIEEFNQKIEEFKMIVKKFLIVLKRQKFDVDKSLILEEGMLEEAKYLSAMQPSQGGYDDRKKEIERIVGILERQLEDISKVMEERTLDSSKLIEMMKTETESLVMQSKLIEIEYLVRLHSKEL